MTDYEPDRRRLERLAAILCERVACQAINDDLLREIAELRPEQTAQLHEQLLVHLDLEEHLAENPPFVSEVMARVREHRGQEEPSEARAPAPQRALAEMFQSERRSKRVLSEFCPSVLRPRWRSSPSRFSEREMLPVEAALWRANTWEIRPDQSRSSNIRSSQAWGSMRR